MFAAADPEISLVLPTYNERGNIASVLEQSIHALERLGRSWEILVVDNHSDDGTPAEVQTTMSREPRVRLIVHDANRLYSGSCQTGLDESRGRYVAIMDSDGQFTAHDLPKFLALLEGGANLVLGWRKRRQDPLSRKLISSVFNCLGRLWLGFPLHDLNVGIRMFDRKFMAVAFVRHAINMANPELFVRAKMNNLVLAETEVQHFERAKGTTSHNFKKLVQMFLRVNRYFRDLAQELHDKKPRPRPECHNRARTVRPALPALIKRP